MVCAVKAIQSVSCIFNWVFDCMVQEPLTFWYLILLRNKTLQCFICYSHLYRQQNKQAKSFQDHALLPWNGMKATTRAFPTNLASFPSFNLVPVMEVIPIHLQTLPVQHHHSFGPCTCPGTPMNHARQWSRDGPRSPDEHMKLCRSTLTLCRWHVCLAPGQM